MVGIVLGMEEGIVVPASKGSLTALTCKKQTLSSPPGGPLSVQTKTIPLMLCS